MELLTVQSNTQNLRNVRVGKNVQIFSFVNAYECTIGDGSKVGAFTEIQKEVVIGRNCKISSHTFICTGVEIEDDVFIGHGVMFTNDLYPRATREDGQLQTEADWQVAKTIIRKGASIGSNATILCGITIGANAIVGAGAVVVKNVAHGTTVAGNPAKEINKR